MSPSRGSGNVNRHALGAGAMETVVTILARVYRCAPANPSPQILAVYIILACVYRCAPAHPIHQTLAGLTSGRTLVKLGSAWCACRLLPERPSPYECFPETPRAMARIGALPGCLGASRRAQGYGHALRRNQAPWQVRAAAFGAVADVLGACMATRHRLYEEQLWRTATAVWPSVIAAGLPAVRLA